MVVMVEVFLAGVRILSQSASRFPVRIQQPFPLLATLEPQD